MRRPCAHALTLAAAMALTTLSAATKPQALLLSVRFDDSAGGESLRRQVELQLAERLERKRCFREVRIHDPAKEPPEGVELALVVTLGEVEDRIDYESSIAARTSPRADPTERNRRLVATIEGDVEVVLLALPGEHPVRSRRFHEETGYRPNFDEDAREEVRRLLAVTVARRATDLACSGSAKALALEIERARAAAP